MTLFLLSLSVWALVLYKLRWFHTGGQSVDTQPGHPEVTACHDNTWKSELTHQRMFSSLSAVCVGVCVCSQISHVYRDAFTSNTFVIKVTLFMYQLCAVRKIQTQIWILKQSHSPQLVKRFHSADTFWLNVLHLCEWCVCTMRWCCSSVCVPLFIKKKAQ